MNLMVFFVKGVACEKCALDVEQEKGFLGGRDPITISFIGLGVLLLNG
jgi:hypothetical protein